jgi:redox-sensing transcriptional repressor
MTKLLKATPKPTLRRLPQYLDFLYTLKIQDKKIVTSKSIADVLGLDQTQVRKDIEQTGITGKPKTGFVVDELIFRIREHLNWNNLSDAFIVGVGSLGTAILGYERFKHYGINFVAAFDADENKIGKKVSGINVYPVSKLAQMAKQLEVHIGVITVPADAAQEVTYEMIKGGIRGIWNFVPKQLIVPENIVVENAQFYQSLAVLTRKLREKIHSENK